LVVSISFVRPPCLLQAGALPWPVLTGLQIMKLYGVAVMATTIGPDQRGLPILDGKRLPSSCNLPHEKICCQQKTYTNIAWGLHLIRT
jgi:hypothetical protein